MRGNSFGYDTGGKVGIPQAIFNDSVNHNDNKMEEQFLIPIDDAIEAFRHHLDAHDRTILSARFGDGKSFFLSHFMENPDVSERYTFLTIFPVNYQVTENRDIFDLIKRDILLQILLKGVIETEVMITDEVALALYLQCQPFSFAESFLPLLSELALNEDAAKAVAVALAGKKFFKNIKQKLDKIKEKSRDSQLDAFLNAVEKNPVVGQDAISSIIQHCLQQYRDKHPNKRIVLVIEDLDRIDPAHLFRILNIFSAHIDFCYRLGCRPDKSLAGNKFGLDKVIFVMDYRNVHHIYSHFYGEGANFEGYIEKFCSSNHFTYSLEEQRDKYYLQQIENETGLRSSLLNNLIKPADFKNMSVRKVVHAIENTANSVICIATGQNNEDKTIPLHQGILRLIAIFRKLGIEDTEIISRISRAIDTKVISSTGFFMYLAPYLNLAAYKNARGDMRFHKSTDMANTFHVDNILDDGRAHCTYTTSMNYDENAGERLLDLLRKVLMMVAN